MDNAALLVLALVLAGVAGIGLGLAWGYRTALGVAQGRPQQRTPKPPRGPDDEPSSSFIPRLGRRDEVA